MAERESQKNISNEPDPIWKWWKGEGGWMGEKEKEPQKNVSSEGDPIWEWWKGEGTWLGKQPTKGFSFLVNGTVGEAAALALTGALIGSVKLGERWKKYGRENFPLDFFTDKGRATMRAEFKKMKAAFGRIG